MECGFPWKVAGTSISALSEGVALRVNEDLLKKIIKEAQIDESVIDSDIRCSLIEARNSKFEPTKMVKVGIKMLQFEFVLKSIHPRSSLLPLTMEVQDMNFSVS